MIFKIGDLVTIETYDPPRAGRVIATRRVPNVFSNRAQEIYLVRHEGTDRAEWRHPIDLAIRPSG